MDDIREVNVRGTVYNIAAAADISLAPIEAGTLASKAYSKDDLLIFSGRLCKATTSIAEGDTLAVGTNLAYDTVAEEIDTINDSLEVTDSGTTANIRFGVDANGNYGYKKVGADTVTPFKTKHTETYSVTSNGTKDMGEDHKYRYVNANVAGVTTINCGSGNTLNETTFNIASITTAYRSLALGSNLFVHITSSGVADFRIDGGGSPSYNASTGVLTVPRMTYFSDASGRTLYINYTVYARV